tara:strand:+ start:884 stop:1135 length:252 start_codon:yes stop_codon:yes gene_type:complete
MPIQEYVSSSLMHVPNMFRWAMASSAGTFNEEGSDVAARMFALAGLFPLLPAGQLRQLAESSDALTVTVDDDSKTVTIEWSAP